MGNFHETGYDDYMVTETTSVLSRLSSSMWRMIISKGLRKDGIIHCRILMF